MRFLALLAVPLLAQASPLAEGTNRHFRHAVETTAAPEAVWARWTDPATWAAWDAEIASAEAEGPLRLGATGRLTTAGGRTVPFEVVQWEPGVRYAYATPLPGGRLLLTRWLEPASEGTVRLVHDVEFQGGGRALAPVLGRRFRKVLPQVMEALAAQAEGADQ
jgi:uncharacterized protein YndB with AHSA1/START domain